MIAYVNLSEGKTNKTTVFQQQRMRKYDDCKSLRFITFDHSTTICMNAWCNDARGMHAPIIIVMNCILKSKSICFWSYKHFIATGMGASTQSKCFVYKSRHCLFSNEYIMMLFGLPYYNMDYVMFGIDDAALGYFGSVIAHIPGCFCSWIFF